MRHPRFAAKNVERGSLIYTGKFPSYDVLMGCGYRHLKFDHTKRIARGSVHINGLDDVWHNAKYHLHKLRGVAVCGFPLCLKELEAFV